MSVTSVTYEMFVKGNVQPNRLVLRWERDGELYASLRAADEPDA